MLSKEKINKIQKSIRHEGIDGLFCRLSVNVLALLGYWPGNHGVAAVIPANGRPVLLVSETEYENVLQEVDEGLVDIETYAFESMSVLRGITDSMLTDSLPLVFNRIGMTDGKLGVEKTFEDGASARLFGDFKYPSEATWSLLEKSFPKVKLIDATGLINRLRWVKTPDEVGAVKKAIEVACMGYEAVKRNIRAGMTEADLSAVLEGEILSQGTGKNGYKYSRGFSSIYSGPRSAMQWVHWACSTGRVIEDHDMVLMELGSVTDGYWCDLTRCTCAGEPSEKARKILETVLKAQSCGLDAAKPGNPISEIDKACHKYFESQGYGPELYKHACGHGTGFNYHEGPPVHQAANGIILEEGMVLCVEPGLYFEGEFGIRMEDIIVVTKDGAKILSNYSHDFITQPSAANRIQNSGFRIQ